MSVSYQWLSKIPKKYLSLKNSELFFKKKCKLQTMPMNAAKSENGFIETNTFVEK